MHFMKELNNTIGTISFNLFGGGFQHAFSSTGWKKPTNIIWEYNSRKNKDSFYVDEAIKLGLDDNKSENIYGWINESPELTKNIVQFCFSHYKFFKSKFTFIFTHEASLINLDPNLFKFAPCTGTWIKNPEIFKKSKNISMISSNKSFTIGHKKRINFINANKENFDLFGRGFKEIDSKIEGLKDYMFSICIENGFSDHYFTEKILDCFATGTVPVYMGARNIDHYFEKRGIIFIDNKLNFKTLNKELYEKMKPYIKQNFEKLKKYLIAEDYLYETYFKKC